MTSKNIVRAAIYLRISQDRTGQEAGVQRQEDECRALAAELGWTVVDVFPDNDTSAYSRKPRPEFERLLREIAAGRIDGVLAWHTDRLYRRPRDLERLTEAMEAHGVVARTVKAGPLDMSTASAVGMAKIGAVFAEMSSAQTAERVRAAAKQRAALGRPSGGPRCYGYDKSGREVVPAEAEAIRTAVAGLLAGRSLTSVAAAMPPRPERPGQPWRSGHLRTLLLGPRIAGWSAHGVEDAMVAARKARGDVASAIFASIAAPAVWPAIVDDEDWRSVVALLTHPARRQTPGSAPKHLLSGIARCAVCGAPLRVSTAKRGGKVRSYYRCPIGGHSRREATELEAYVVDQTLRVLDRIEPPPVDEPAKGLAGSDPAAELAGVRRRLGKLAELFATGTLDEDQFEAGAAKARARITELEALTAPTGPTKPALTAVRRHPVPSEAWPELPLDTKQALLRELWTLRIQPWPEVGTDEGRLAYAEAKRTPHWGVELVAR